MNVTIVKPRDLTLAQLDKLVDDIWEAWDYQREHGVEVNVSLEGFTRAGRPIYKKLDFTELDGRQRHVLEQSIEMGDKK